MSSGTQRFLSGWCDLSIRELIRDHETTLARFSYVLVTSLDSLTDLATSRIGRQLVERYPDCGALGSGVLIPGRLVSEIERSAPLFFGFDEVWCYDAEPPAAKPGEVSIVPPPDFRSESPAADVLEWMDASGCRLALADGMGMNYVTPDLRIRDALSERIAASCQAVVPPGTTILPESEHARNPLQMR